jgi:hypothetical protein
VAIGEPSGHTFLVRVWIEQTADEAGALSWRGHVTHLPDGDRRYVQAFDDVATFISERLADDSAGAHEPPPAWSRYSKSNGTAGSDESGYEIGWQ